MKRYLYFACIFTLILSLAGCAVQDATGKSSAGKKPAVYVKGLGSGYGIAFDQSGNLYAKGSDNDKPVIWKIDNNKNKEIFCELDLSDPILSMFDGSPSFETNMTVDGAGNIWMSSSLNGQCYVVSAGREARVVYLNEQISVSFDAKDDAKGIAWDKEKGKLYIVTSGPESSSSYSGKLVFNLTTLTPSEDNFAEELETCSNGWDPLPLYVKNDGKVLKQSGIALVKAKDSLYLIGENQVYALSANGKTEKFGKAFSSLQLYDGTADDKGNIYITANTAGDPESEKGRIYKLGKNGASTLLAKNAGRLRGIAYYKGYLYVKEMKSGDILRLAVR